MDEERRRHPRRLNHVKALAIVDGAPAQVLNCVIRNYSATGAKLSFASTFNVPDAFQLRIPILNEIHFVQVRWRSDDAVGVEFEREFDRFDITEEMEALQRRLDYLRLFTTEQERMHAARRARLAERPTPVQRLSDPPDRRSTSALDEAATWRERTRAFER